MRTYVILKSPDGTAGSLATTGGRLAVQASSHDSVAAMAKQAVYKIHTFHVSGQENKQHIGPSTARLLSRKQHHGTSS